MRTKKTKQTEALNALRALDLAAAKLWECVSVIVEHHTCTHAEGAPCPARANLETVQDEVLRAACRYGQAMAACGATVKPRTN